MIKGFDISRRILALTAGVLTAVVVVQAQAITEKGRTAPKGAEIGKGSRVELSPNHTQAIESFEKSIGKLGKGTSEKVKAALAGDAATSGIVLGVLTNNPIKNKELAKNYLAFVSTKPAKEGASETCDKVFELSKNLNGWDAQGVDNLNLFQASILKNLDAGMSKAEALTAARAEMEKLGLKDLSEAAKRLETCT